MTLFLEYPKFGITIGGGFWLDGPVVLGFLWVLGLGLLEEDILSENRKEIPLIEENQRKGGFEQSSDAVDSRLRVSILREKFGIESIEKEG